MDTKDDILDAEKKYIRRVMKLGLLERDEEQALAVAWRDHDDEQALHRLIMAYSRLVVSVAAKFKHYGLPFGDLIQEGHVGMMQAAGRFDVNRQVRFSTYSVWWIKAAIQDYILRNWSIVRTGTTSAHKALFFKLRHLRALIGEADGGVLTDEGRQKIAESIGVNLADVNHMEQRLSGGLSGADSSLNAPIHHDGLGHGDGIIAQDVLVDDRPTPEQSVAFAKDTQTLSKWLTEALEELSPREKIIILRRRLDEKAMTLDELGRNFGVSKERIRQLELRAMEKIKTSLQARVDDTAHLPYAVMPHLS